MEKGSDKIEVKNFSTRKMPAVLHYRLGLISATLNCSKEEAFNQVMALGLDAMERAIRGKQ